MSPEQERMLKEIHAAIVYPEEASLLAAAKAVVDARYSTNDWDALKNAISRLADVLETAGKLDKGNA